MDTNGPRLSYILEKEKSRKPGVPGEKLSKNRKDELRELNSHVIPNIHLTWFHGRERHREG